jgi:anaerobic ribonucleoside-triphosphate reductase
MEHYSYEEGFKEVFKKLKRLEKYDELAELDGIGSQLDIQKFSKRFFSRNINLTTADISVDSNSNVDDSSIIQYELEAAKPLHRLNSYYLLWKYSSSLFSEEVAIRMLKAQFTKEIYVNDFHSFNGKPYCFNYSCMDILNTGLPFVNRIKSKPPKHLSSFNGQMVQFIIYASNSTSGAVGLADYLICVSYFVEKMLKEEEPEKVWEQVKQELQGIIFSINQPSRNGSQSPFTNVSIFDDVFLKKFCGEYIFPDGSNPKIETVKKIQEMFLDLMNEILEESPITFPIVTACFSVDEDRNILDNSFLDFVIEKNLKYGFLNLYAGKISTLSSCCRLRSDTSNKEYYNAFGSGGTKIGSIGVVTLNLPRIAYTSKTKEEFLDNLKELVLLASQINQVKRHIIQKRIDNRYAPLYDLGIISLKKQYSTCGLVGIAEAVEIMEENILESKGQEFVKNIIDIVNMVSDVQQDKYKAMHNVEQVPAESSAIVLASSDRILGYNKNYSIYSNQFIPLVSKADILDRIKLQGLFDSYLSGGAILHLNFSERITDKEFIRNLLIKSIKQGVVYQALNYNIQRCTDEHISVGKNKKCPACGKNIKDNFTRIVGFLVNTSNWNKVRREKDYPNRVWYGDNND